jgi:hypothetical protein
MLLASGVELGSGVGVAAGALVEVAVGGGVTIADGAVGAVGVRVKAGAWVVLSGVGGRQAANRAAIARLKQRWVRDMGRARPA